MVGGNGYKDYWLGTFFIQVAVTSVFVMIGSLWLGLLTMIVRGEKPVILSKAEKRVYAPLRPDVKELGIVKWYPETCKTVASFSAYYKYRDSSCCMLLAEDGNKYKLCAAVYLGPTIGATLVRTFRVRKSGGEAWFKRDSTGWFE